MTMALSTYPIPLLNPKTLQLKVARVVEILFFLLLIQSFLYLCLYCFFTVSGHLPEK